MYEYNASVIRIIDGDTLELAVDLGFGIEHDIIGELKNINTHKIHFVDKGTEEYRRGKEEYDFVNEWIVDAEENWNGEHPLIIHSHIDDSIERDEKYLVEILRKDKKESLNKTLIEEFDDIN